MDYELTLPSLGWLVLGMAFLLGFANIWSNMWRVVFKRSVGVKRRKGQRRQEKLYDAWGSLWLPWVIGPLQPKAFFPLLCNFCADVRHLVFSKSVEADVPWEKVKDTWPSVLPIFVAVTIPAWGVYLFFSAGQQFVFPGYVIGGALLVLFFFQLPRVRPPAVYIFAQGSEDGESPTGENLTQLSVKRGTETLFFFFVGNTGINGYEACETLIRLSRNCLTPVGNEQMYEKVDFRQVPEIQKGNNAARYRGGTISPATVLAVPLWLKAHGQAESGQVRVEFACPSRWGSAVESFEVDVHD